MSRIATLTEPDQNLAWEEALLAYPGAELAHTWEWGGLIQAVYGYQPLYDLLTTPGAPPVPVTAFYARTCLSGKKITTMPFMFQAPLLRPDAAEPVLNHLICLAQSRQAYVELKLRAPLPTDVIEHFQLQELTTSVYSAMPLAGSTAAQQDAYPKNLRQNLKRSQNRLARETGFTLSTETNAETITLFHHCMMRMYRDKDHMPCQPLALLLEIYRRFGAHVRLFSAWEGQCLVSGIFATAYGDRVEYAWGATQAGYEKWNFPLLLLDQTAAWGIERGCRTMSFGCSSAEDTGLLTFKARWGCTQTPVYHYYHGKHIQPVSLTNKDTISRKLYAGLPLPLIQAMLPVVVPQLG